MHTTTKNSFCQENRTMGYFIANKNALLINGVFKGLLQNVTSLQRDASDH
jgi:uncharacterized membrane protein (UPF0136 family)